MADTIQEVSNSIFLKVKPKCVKLAELTLLDSSKSNSLDIVNALKDLDEVLQKAVSDAKYKISENIFMIPLNLSDYIGVPLMSIFKKEQISDSELEHTLSIICILLENSWCRPGFLSKQMYIEHSTLITYMIGGKPGNFVIKSHSDETFMNGVKCLKVLLTGCMNQSTEFAQDVLKDTNYIPTLGFMISVLLNIAALSQIQEIKSESLDTLNVLFHLIDDGEILSLFFPGVVSTVAKIIKSKPHTNVITQCFITLSTISVRLFSDFDLSPEILQTLNSLETIKQNLADIQSKHDNENELYNISKISDIKIPESIGDKKLHRTTNWLKTTLIQYKKALDIILGIDFDRYDKYVLKDSVFQFCIKTIRTAFVCCGPLIPTLLKSLSAICFSDDSFTGICVDSLAFISDGEQLKDIIYEILNSENQKMELNLTSPDPMKAEHMFYYINFLLKVLITIGSPDEIIFKSTILKLKDTLVFLIELNATEMLKLKINTSKTNIETQLMLVSSQYIKGSFDQLTPAQLFDGIFTKDTEKQLNKLFETIALNKSYIPNLESILCDIGDTSNIKGQVASSVASWILMNILIHIRKETTRIDIEDYLIFDDKSDNENEVSDDTTIIVNNLVYSALESSTEILKLCSLADNETSDIVSSTIMSLRTIDNAIMFQNKGFEDELIDVLYPVVECLASSNEMIRTESQIVVLKLANLLYEGSIEKLLSENSDYLVDALSSKLLGNLLTPKIPIILSILVRIGSMNIVSELDDIIKVIFTLIDMYYGYNALVEGFFLVFNEVILKVYEDLQSYDFEKLSIDLEEDDVLHFGMWGLQSTEDVDKFVEQNYKALNDLLADSDDENISIDETLKKSKILEIDSDDSDDENLTETETKSIGSTYSNDNSNKNSSEEIDEDEWTSPLDHKLFDTIANIIFYAERMVQSNSVSLNITLLKIIKRIIPLLATQKNKFLPIAVTIWGITSNILLSTTDFKIINLCIDILYELIKYGNTFLTTRFIDLFFESKQNKFLQNLILKKVDSIKKSQFTSSKLINASSTSINWEVETFNKMCQYYIFSLKKLGRFIPNDVALRIIEVTVYYDMDIDNYGYFDDMLLYMKEYLNMI